MTMKKYKTVRWLSVANRGYWCPYVLFISFSFPFFSFFPSLSLYLSASLAVSLLSVFLCSFLHVTVLHFILHVLLMRKAGGGPKTCIEWHRSQFELNYIKSISARSIFSCVAFNKDIANNPWSFMTLLFIVPSVRGNISAIGKITATIRSVC